MSSAYVRDTVWAYLTTNWVETRIIDVLNLYQTEEVQGDPITEWVTMMDESSVESQVSVGAPGNQRWREEGVLAFIAYTESGTGSARARELAEMLRDLFREQQISAGAGQPTVVFRQIEPPATVLPSSVDASAGVWFGFAVSAIYYCDFCR